MLNDVVNWTLLIDDVREHIVKHLSVVLGLLAEFLLDDLDD